MKVDFRAKKSEAEWLQTWDRFFLAATPKLFEWLGWCVLLSAVGIVRQVSGNAVLAIIQTVCIAALWFYFAAYFNRMELVGFLRPKPKVARFASIVISSAVAGIAYWVSRIAVAALSHNIGA